MFHIIKILFKIYDFKVSINFLVNYAVESRKYLENLEIYIKILVKFLMKTIRDMYRETCYEWSTNYLSIYKVFHLNKTENTHFIYTCLLKF